MSISTGRPAMTEPAWAGALALGSGVVVYDGPGASAQRHRHDAVQLVIGVDAPVEAHIESRSAVVGATVVRSGAVHERAASGRTLVVLVEPFGSAGAAISRFAERHAGTDLSGRLGPLAAPPVRDAGDMVAWSRSVLEVRGGRDLTTAAAWAGFADSAHFSRVFRSMFGLTPSEVLPLLDIVDVEFDIGS